MGEILVGFGVCDVDTQELYVKLLSCGRVTRKLVEEKYEGWCDGIAV